MYYSLRITTDEKLNFSKFIKNTNLTKYLFSPESGNETEKRHYQCALYTETKLQTLRSNFKKLYPEYVGNEKYSLKSRFTPYNYKTSVPCDENIFAYCAKENEQLTDEHITSLTKDEFKGYHKQYHLKNQQFKEVKKAYKKEAKKKKETLLSSAVTFLCDGNYTLDKKPIMHSMTGEQTVQKLISFFMKTETLFNEHTFKWLYLSIIKKYNSIEYEEYMKMKTKHLINFN